MCGPAAVIAGASAAISIGSAIAEHKAREDREEAVEKAARESFLYQIDDINFAETEVQEQRSRSIFEAERQARAALALERVSQGEAGVAGVSAQAVQEDIVRDAAEFRTATDRQTDRRLRALENRKLGARQQMENRIEGVQGGNPFLLGLRIAGAGLQAGYSIANSGPSAETTTSN